MTKCFGLTKVKRNGEWKVICEPLNDEAGAAMKSQKKCCSMECPFYKPIGKRNWARLGKELIER